MFEDDGLCVGPSDEISKRWLEQFNLAPLDELDFVIGSKVGLPIGLKSEYSPSMKRAVLAAALSNRMGLRSIDYTLKRYVDEDAYEEKTEGVGNSIHRFLSGNIEQARAEYFKFTERPVILLGDQIADVNLMRVYSSLKASHILANRGLLFETLCLVRFILGQLAWCRTCETLDDEEQILALQATECIGAFKSIYPTSGRLYGHLSNVAHWNPELHHLFVTQREDLRMASTLASCRFKAIALSYTLLAFDMYHTLVERIYPDGAMQFRTLNSDGTFDERRQTKTFVQKAVDLFPEEIELKSVLQLFP